MPFSQLFDDTFRREVEVITRDSTLSDNALRLHNDAERYLQVLAHPSFGDINQPAWVRRIRRFSYFSITYTSSKLFDALYDTADELWLVAGKRYVSATVCVCAGRAERLAASPEDRPRCIAEALSQLASAWMAYMLWPFFIDGVKFASEVVARPRCLPQTFESTASQSYTDHRLVAKEDLLKLSGYACFMTGYVYAYGPPELFNGPEPVTVADVQVTHILRPPCAMRERGMREDDEVVTVDILKHYCGPIICLEGAEVPEGAAEARNSLVMEANSCAAFHGFRWCLHPSQVANQYHVEVHERNWLGTQYVASPSPVIFEVHSYKHSYSEPSSSGSPPSSATSPSSSCDNPPTPRAHGSQRNVDPPGGELLRVHAALAGAMQLSGAMTAFEAILHSCELLDEACVPGASGSTFLQSVVAYEGREVCADVEMRGIAGARAVRATADDSDSD